MTALIITLHGTDTATCGDVSVKSNKAPICELARKLRAAGVDGHRQVTVTRNGKPVFADDLMLGNWAATTVREGDLPATLHTWAPNPMNFGGDA